MPTYEYECTKCKHRFERFQSMTDEPVKRCPKCRSKVRRMFSPGAGIIFKGSGFYETDYRSDSYKSAAKKDADAGSVKAGKSEKAETKKIDAKKPASGE
jgi:putative FmdB family regulatory protein